MKWPKVNFSGWVAWLRKSDNLLLLGILLLALVLRLWGIGFGLPYTYHIDEPPYVRTALKLGSGIFANPPFDPTGFANMLFVEYGLLYGIGRVGGLFGSTAEFELLYRSNPTIFFLLSRLTSVFWGSVAVLTVYYLGKSLHSSRLGLLSALFLAVSFLYVRDSHYGTPDVAMSSLVILAILFAVYFIRTGRPRFAVLSGIAAGFAISTKWIALPILLPLFLAIVFRRKMQSGDHRRFQLLSMASCVIAGVLIGIIIGSFQIFLDPMPFYSKVVAEFGTSQSPGFMGIWQVDTLSGWVFYLNTLSMGVGIIMLGLTVMGMLGCLFLATSSQRYIWVTFMSFPLAYYVLMGSTRHYFSRYALPLIPFLAIFAAFMIVAVIVQWLESTKISHSRLIATLLVLLSIMSPLLKSIRHDILLVEEDTRTIAKAWIETHLANNSRIAVDWPVHAPPLSTQDQPVPYSNRVYDLTIVGGTGLADHSLDWYREQGFDYLIASSFIYNIPLVYPERNAARRAFYEELDQKLELVQSFWPGEVGEDPPFIFDEIYGPTVSLWQRERPGPVIKIYRLTP